MKRKFTLIELLVVIAIIAILAAMLLPTLKSARDVALRTACLNNHKTIGTVMGMYWSDFNEYMPIGTIGRTRDTVGVTRIQLKASQRHRNRWQNSWDNSNNGWGSWDAFLTYFYLGSVGKAFWCPANPVKVGDSAATGGGVRQWGISGGDYVAPANYKIQNGLKGVRLTELLELHKPTLLIFADFISGSTDNMSYHPNFYSGGIRPHDTLTNMTKIDLSSQTMDRQEVYFNKKTYWK